MRRKLIQWLFYPTYGWNYLLSRVLHLRPYSSEITESVILGALPLRSHVPGLKHQGVRAVINMCEEYPGPEKEYRACGIRQLRLPTLDFTCPSSRDLEAAVEFMRNEIPKGRIYVHCKAGRKRSAAVVLCWLMASQNLTPEEAQSLLLKGRPHANRHLHQEVSVLEFRKALLSAQANPPIPDR